MANDAYPWWIVCVTWRDNDPEKAWWRDVAVYSYRLQAQTKELAQAMAEREYCSNYDKVVSVAKEVWRAS